MAAAQFETFLSQEETLSSIVLTQVFHSEDIAPEERLDDTSLDIALDAKAALELMKKFSFFNKDSQSSPYALLA